MMGGDRPNEKLREIVAMMHIFFEYVFRVSGLMTVQNGVMAQKPHGAGSILPE
jgi:hypothetical protein